MEEIDGMRELRLGTGMGMGIRMVTVRTLGLIVEAQNLWFVVLGRHGSWHVGTVVCLHVGHCEC